MSSRQEEKQQRRAEREAAQAKATQAEQRKRLTLIAAGVAAVLLAVVIGVVTLSGGDDKSITTAGADVQIPGRKIEDLNAAVKAAGCVFKEHANEGQTHSEKPFNDYKTNPPTSGTHNPVPAEDGIYDPGTSPSPNNWIHTLEHGRIIVQYKPGTPKRQIAQLETLVSEELKGSTGYKQLLLENTTKMPYAVAAVAWTKTVGCKTMNDKVFDAIRAFREKYVDKAPEFVP